MTDGMEGKAPGAMGAVNHGPASSAGHSQASGQAAVICYIIGTLDRGGSEGQLIELATRLDRRRFRPHICCLSSTGPLQAEAERADVPVTIIGFRGFRVFRQPVAVARQVLKLVAYLRALRPAILHGYLFWAYVIGTLAAWIAGVPHVVSSRRGLARFKADKPHYRLLEAMANRLTDVWIANSQAVREDAIRAERLDPARVRVVPNGLDIARYEAVGRHAARAVLGLSPNTATALTVANLIHYKGHQTLLRTAALLPGIRWLLVGEGPMRPAIERQIRELGLGTRVALLGERRDVSELLAVADLLVHPSDEEGFPNAVLEAMAAGLPVVATRVGGTPELVQDGITGLLVPPGSPEALAQAVGRLLAAPETARRMGSAGRRRAMCEFPVERMVARTEAVYEELLGGHSLPHGEGRQTALADNVRALPGSGRDS